MNHHLGLFVFSWGVATAAPAQTSASARYISPLDCVDRSRAGDKNIVERGDMVFQVSQRDHDQYNQFNISHQETISDVEVGRFVFKSFPTRDELDNGAYSKKLHFDVYDYGNLNGNKDIELMRAGDNIYVTFLVKFVTPAPIPERGSRFDNGNGKFKRNVFFQFWPGGVVTHLYSYPSDGPDAPSNRFGYVTVLTDDYGTNKPTLSVKFDVEQGRWYRMYFQYKPDVKGGRIFAKMAPHRQGLATRDMTTLLDVRGNTLYETKSGRRILPTFGNYHWGGSPTILETHFSEILVSKEPLRSHTLRPGRPRPQAPTAGTEPPQSPLTESR